MMAIGFTWTLIILVNTSGFFSADVRAIQLSMMTKEACVNAANTILKESSKISVTCIGSETGEIIRVKNEK